MKTIAGILVACTIMMGLCSCDRFVVYHLLVKDMESRPLPRVEVEEVGMGFSQLTDSVGYLQLTKITGGIRPDLTKKVKLHKDGYRDTIVNLKPEGEIQIRLSHN